MTILWYIYIYREINSFVEAGSIVYMKGKYEHLNNLQIDLCHEFKVIHPLVVMFR
jgi:hypothetical protein